MKLFNKKTPPAEPPGRRRPTASDRGRAPAFSYYAQRSGSQANTGRTMVEEANRSPERSGDPVTSRSSRLVFVGVLIALGLLTYVLWLDGNPRVVPVLSSGNSYFTHDMRPYQQTAAQTLASSIFNKNKLTLDTNKIAKDLTNDYPEIHTVSVSLPVFGHQAVVYIEPYRPAFIMTSDDHTAYLLDENGRAVVPTSQLTDVGSLNVPTLHDKSGLKVAAGAQALPSATVHFAEQVVSILNAANVRYDNLVLPAASSELDVSITGTSYYVKFNLEGDAKLQTGTYLAASQRLQRDHTTVTEYVDVRVPERAYYR